MRYCRYGAAQGPNVFIFGFIKFPENVAHSQYSDWCWDCWNNDEDVILLGLPPCLEPPKSKPGSMYFAFGVLANNTNNRTYYNPERSFGKCPVP
jgi:hypothetical protein